MSGKAKKSSLRQLRQKKRVDYRLMHTGKDAENESCSSDETASEIEKVPVESLTDGGFHERSAPCIAQRSAFIASRRREGLRRRNDRDISRNVPLNN